MNRFISGQGFAYDKNGNIISDVDASSSLTRSFVFNGDNKQTEVRDAGNNLVGEYFFDGEGKRIKKRTYASGVLNEETVFVYSSGKLVAEYSNKPPAENATTQWTVTDQLGSPRILTNSLGEVVSRRDFMPFGEEIIPDGNNLRTENIGYKADTIRQKFTGYLKDEETQLDFAEARMYQNLHGRFTAVDPLLASGKSANPQTFNRYVYVLNNPLVLTDPTGLQVSSDPDEEYIGSVDTYWDIAGNKEGTFAGYLESIGQSIKKIEQTIRYYAFSSGQSERLSVPSNPVTRNLNGVVNPVTGPSIQAFGRTMDNFNETVIQPIPFLNSTVNMQMAGVKNDKWAFAKGAATFTVDLGTSVFPGGGGAARKGIQEVAELSGTKSFDLALGLAAKGETNLVYHGLDAAGTVKYFGITERAAGVRFAEHLNSGTTRSLLDFEIVPGATGLTRTQARVWEQTLINQYGLGKNGGQLLNKVNSIAPKYWWQYGIK